MAKSVYYTAALSLLIIGAVPPSVHADAPIPAAIAAAVADPRRPRDQVSLDAVRKPAQFIAFAQLKSGDRVADFMPGNGYFTRLMSDVVGPGGHVYAFLPAEQLANCAPTEVDVIWTAQNYHDLHDSFMAPTNVAELNKVFFKALKPGGTYLVIDHIAEGGSGIRDTESLHRIDPLRLRKEVEAAGFILEAQSDVLRNAADDHKLPVFDAGIRGRTDQPVYKFRKPKF
jgi:predicted methyltransferase